MTKKINVRKLDLSKINPQDFVGKDLIYASRMYEGNLLTEIPVFMYIGKVIQDRNYFLLKGFSVIKAEEGEKKKTHFIFGQRYVGHKIGQIPIFDFVDPKTENYYEIINASTKRLFNIIHKGLDSLVIEESTDTNLLKFFVKRFKCSNFTRILN